MKTRRVVRPRVLAKRTLSSKSASLILEPQARRHAPTCADYADRNRVMEYEREMRLHRAATERFELSAPKGAPNGTFQVVGTSGRAYIVSLVDNTGQHDVCNCPDFASNELDLCKHLAAVRRGIASNRHLTQAFSALGPRPITPTIGFRGAPAPRLEALGRQDKRALRAVADGDLVGLAQRGWRVLDGAARIWVAQRAQQARLARQSGIDTLIQRGELDTQVLTAPLFPYQRDGVLHLVRAGRALLADDMGLGKTVQAIAACEVLRRRGEARRILIVTPASLKAQWAQELERYTGQRAVVIGGLPAQRRAALASDAAYLIVNYEILWRDFSIFAQLPTDVVVLDEAQRAKNFRTKTAATLRGLGSRHLFVLTGTPVENRLDDLYSLLQLIDPTLLGPLWRFNHQFHEQNARGKIVGCHSLGALRELISTTLLRRRKEEVLSQLPSLTEQHRYIPLSPRQIELEEHHRREAGKLMSIAERRALTKIEQDKLMANLLKARQACNAAELCDTTAAPSSAKLDELEVLVQEIVAQGNAKILVFSEWTEMLRLASHRLAALDIDHLILHGGVPTEKRPALLDRFRHESSVRVLLSTDAGGVGLNLQCATYVIHLDLPWNPGRLDQRTARAHRLGQSRGVSVIYLCAETGIERGIEGTLRGKRALRSAALDVTSTVEEVETPSFAVFLRELRAVLAPDVGLPLPDGKLASLAAVGATHEAGPAATSEAAPVAATPPAAASVAATAEAASVAAAPEAAPVAATPPATPKGRADDRLRLAEVVLQAGFPLDAVSAAYQAVATAIRALLPEPAPTTHGALVAEVYRTLIPSGRLPHSAHGLLARAHDLAALAEHGVTIETALAAELVAEARLTCARLST